MQDFSHVANAHPTYIENLFRSWQSDPSSVAEDWQGFFKGFDYAVSNSNGSENGAASASNTTAPTIDSSQLGKEFGVIGLIHGYRDRGHLLATISPIPVKKDKEIQVRLDLADYGLGDADLDKTFAAGYEIGMPNAPLRAIVERLKALYCGNIGFEAGHIQDKAMKMWLREKIENRTMQADYGFSKDKKRRIFQKLNNATIFEEFLHTKFIGQKRFSLEGGESVVPGLDAIIQKCAEGDVPVEEVVIGMAHRGRLNVLGNILGKTYEQIFTEFVGTNKTLLEQSYGAGDVKYHLGYSSMYESSNGKKTYVKLLPNPSHLEAVDAVALGFARAKADTLYGGVYDRVLPIVIHGDSAVAGQGVVYETIQMSGLSGYYTGGSIHLVINNQIGFTTNMYDARTSIYCSDVAKVVQVPVFHVNGDDPEAMVFACELATEFRRIFNVDVFVDMVCYRKYGHNESDEPRFTQPAMWAAIGAHDTPREVYLKTLESRGDVDKALGKEMKNQYKKELQARLDEVTQKEWKYSYQEPEKAWQSLRFTMDDADFQSSPSTGISKAVFDKLTAHLTAFPEGFTALPQIQKLMESKQDLLNNGELDWHLGELLAYASILQEGKDVRFSGQDVKRGTFSHRHACPVDSKTYQEINRLDGIGEGQGKLRIYNSLLSEYAVLGFEYGYSMANPNNLVIWEAQFGDFANGASTIVDQFISAGESKWKRMNGIVMLLPHGYEGQGPEHSSARLERYLQMCAENNMIVANVTTSANLFHIMRRQLAWEFRKPLIIMSPKSTLRPPYCISPAEDFLEGKCFQELLDDSKASAKKVKRLVVCTGKVYYDLLKKQEDEKRSDIALVRLEQMYPFPKKQFDELRKKYAKAELVWVQEEPKNMGAWSYIVTNQPEYGWKFEGRPAAASPATGFYKTHAKEQEALVNRVFAL